MFDDPDKEQAYFIWRLKKLNKNQEENEYRVLDSNNEDWDLSHYIISEHGDVFSLQEKVYLKRWVLNGYKSVNLVTNVKSTGQKRELKGRLHVLFAATFCGEEKDKSKQVNHIDHNPLNNHSSNLRWLTVEEHAAIHRDVSKRKEKKEDKEEEVEEEEEEEEEVEEEEEEVEEVEEEYATIGSYFGADFKDYQISASGKIRRVDSNRKIKGHERKDGYIIVSLKDAKTGKPKAVFLHRLVCYVFNRDQYSDERNCVDHINSVKNDNRAENLRFVTQKENNEFAHGVNVLCHNKNTDKWLEFNTIGKCLEKFKDMYPSLKYLLYDGETVFNFKNHVFYRGPARKITAATSFYVD